jgi:hypothetical protein
VSDDGVIAAIGSGGLGGGQNGYLKLDASGREVFFRADDIGDPVMPDSSGGGYFFQGGFLGHINRDGQLLDSISDGDYSILYTGSYPVGRALWAAEDRGFFFVVRDPEDVQQLWVVRTTMSFGEIWSVMIPRNLGPYMMLLGQDPNQNVVLGGVTTDIQRGTRRLHVLRVSESGDATEEQSEEWPYTSGGVIPGTQVYLAEDGRILVSESRYFPTTVRSRVLVFNDMLSMVWSHVFGSDEVLSALTITTDHLVAVIGATRVSSGVTRPILTLLDAQGGVISRSEFRSDAYEDRLNNVYAVGGGFVLCGDTRAAQGEPEKTLIVKSNALGEFPQT